MVDPMKNPSSQISIASNHNSIATEPAPNDNRPIAVGKVNSSEKRAFGGSALASILKPKKLTAAGRLPGNLATVNG